jgi:hypothetical protein
MVEHDRAQGPDVACKIHLQGLATAGGNVLRRIVQRAKWKSNLFVSWVRGSPPF